MKKVVSFLAVTVLSSAMVFAEAVVGKPKPVGDRVIAEVVEQPGRPAQRCGGVADGCQSMTDIVFSEFEIQNLQVRLYGDTGIAVGENIIKAHKGKRDLLGGKFVWTDTFVKKDGAWKVVASQITPVLEK